MYTSKNLRFSSTYSINSVQGGSSSFNLILNKTFTSGNTSVSTVLRGISSVCILSLEVTTFFSFARSCLHSYDVACRRSSEPFLLLFKNESLEYLLLEENGFSKFSQIFNCGHSESNLLIDILCKRRDLSIFGQNIFVTNVLKIAQTVKGSY